MKISAYLSFAMLIFSSPAVPYSILWVGTAGEPLQPRHAREMAMGGVSIAIPYHLAGPNPASLSLTRTSSSLTGVQEIVSSGDGEDRVTSYDFRLPELTLAFPLPWDAAIDARYTQAIDADFDLASNGTVDDIPFVHELSRDGSIGNVSIGVGKTFNVVTVGLRGGFNFGSFQDEQRIDFESQEYEDSYDQLLREFSGFAYDAGFLLRLAGFSVGGVHRAKSDCGSDLLLPPSYGIGLAYSHRNLLMGVDYNTSVWSESDDEYENAYSAGVGCEYALGQTKLRAGYRYSSSYCYDITEHTISAGFGFPFRQVNGGLELAVETVLRSSNQDLNERLVRLGFTFWGGEKWERRTTYP